MKTYLLLFASIMMNFINISFAQVESIGPYGGYIRCMTKDSNENVLAGTLYGGIYFTSDLGENWTQIFYGHRNLDVRSLAVSPENIYFAGTDAGGIYRSIDQGKTWEKTNNLFNTETIRTIVALGNNIVLVGTFDGLFKSIDNGNTFTSSSNGITANSISCLAFSGTFLLAGTDYNGIFLSADTAKTWQPENDSLDYNNRTVESIAFSDNSGKSLAKSNADLKDPSKSVVVSLGDKVFQAQYPSFPGEIIWEETPPPPKYIKTINIRVDNSIVGAAVSNITSVGGGIITLPDINHTWNTENVPDFPFGSIVTTPSGTIAGTYGKGAFAKPNDFPNFTLRYKEMFGTSINKIAVGDNVIVTATEASGIFRTFDGGSTWEEFSYNLSDEPTSEYIDLVINKLTGTTFTTTPNGTYRLPKDGTEWQNTNYVFRTLGVNDAGTVFFGNGSNIGYSTDDGLTINKTFVSDIPGVSNFAFKNDRVFISTANLSGTFGNGVWTSTPPYTNWNLDGLAGETVTYVVTLDDSWSSLDCFKDIVLLAGTNNGEIYSRTVNGSYAPLSSGLTSNSKITSIFPYPRFVDTQQPSGLLAATIPVNTNILYPFVASSKFDFGNCEWKDDLASDYIVRNITAENLDQKNAFLKGEQSGQYVLYGTFGTGILRRDLTTDVKNISSNLPASFSLKQNYPNPFNPITTIQFDLPKESFAILEIFNVLGGKVSTLVSENLKAGTYRYEWNASSMPSGVYFYKLSAENFNQTKKLVLMK